MPRCRGGNETCKRASAANLVLGVGPKSLSWQGQPSAREESHSPHALLSPPGTKYTARHFFLTLALIPPHPQSPVGPLWSRFSAAPSFLVSSAASALRRRLRSDTKCRQNRRKCLTRWCRTSIHIQMARERGPGA